MSFFAVNPRVYAVLLAIFAFAFVRRLVVQWRNEWTARRNRHAHDRTGIRGG